jgi:hypothetical protein
MAFSQPECIHHKRLDVLPLQSVNGVTVAVVAADN